MPAKRETREAARSLRQDGFSIGEIATRLHVSKSTISIWVRDIELTSSQQMRLEERQYRWRAQHRGAKANQYTARKQRELYQQAGRLRARQRSPLHMMGCMLYWAEGSKTKRNSVYFVNSDPDMMVLFIRFLREEFDIGDEIFRLQIHCHSSDTDEHNRIISYWTQLLQLPVSSVQKIQIKKGSDKRKNRLENGICALQVHRSEIVQHIYGAIQEYGGFENPAWLF